MGITSAKTLLESHWNWLLGVPKGAFAAGALGSLRTLYSIPKTKLGNQIPRPPVGTPPLKHCINVTRLCFFFNACLSKDPDFRDCDHVQSPRNLLNNMKCQNML